MRPAATDASTREKGVRNTVLAAAAIAFLIELALAPPANLFALLGRLVVYPVGVGIYFLIGRWLGTRTWPRRGRRIARQMLVRQLRDKRHILFLSDRPDFEARTARRVWEVLGFAVGGSVIIASVLIIAGLRSTNLAALAVSFMLLTMWASFLLVPYWLFARLGVRHVDAVRWLILPLSRRYADRLRLSNGALLLIGLGAMVNATVRSGLSQDDAIVLGLRTLVQIVVSVLVIAATGVAYYTRNERALVRELEAEAIELGVRDGRGMTDGQFLPGLPPPKGAPPPAHEPLMPLKIMRP